MDEPDRDRLVADLSADVRRVSERLRGLSQARLAAPCGEYASAADAGRAVAQSLADAAAALEGVAARPLPRLSDFAVGDQVAVAGHDLAGLLSASDGAAPDALAQAAVVATELTAVRRML